MKFKMTPARRFTLAYLTGCGVMLVIMQLIQDWHGKEAYLALVDENWIDMHWAWWLIPLIILNVIYARNSAKFQKETMWMLIKNPRKIDIEEDDPLFQHRPIKPPPPPAPPAKAVNPPRTK